MDNYGMKRGYVGAGSGFLGVLQGDTNMGSKVLLPLWSEPEPQYVNKMEQKNFLLYSRNGKKQKQTGVKRLSIPKDVELQGGIPTKQDYNTI
jgi:hypothetical protein|tara:strand:- start:492 stop:767 length:276 start_codon:yes stop_codon:yes gene_type:complete